METQINIQKETKSFTPIIQSVSDPSPSDLSKMRKYYKTANLFLPKDPNWRFFTFKLRNGTVKRFHINNLESLRKLLIKYLPIVAYYSQGCWINTEDIRGRTKKVQRIKIYSDLVIDIDNEDLDQARLSAIQIIRRLGAPGYIIMTRRGFHVCYYKVDRKKLINQIRNIQFDIKCSENEFGVFSIPLTLNKAGKINIFITTEQLHLPIETLQKMQPQIYIPYNSKGGLVSPNKDNDAVVHPQSLRRNVSEKMQSKLHTEMTLSNPSESRFLSINNQVKKGVYVPILIYEKSFNKLKLELDILNKLFNLGDLYGFESKDYYAFISLRCFQERQLEKLINQSNSITRQQFSKFKKIWFNISDYQLIGVLRYKTNKYFLGSNKHYNFLKDCGVKIDKVDQLVGHPKLKIYEVHK